MLEEVGQTINPKYRQHHQLVIHSIKGCFMLNGKIQYLLENRLLYLPFDSAQGVDKSDHHKESHSREITLRSLTTKN